MLLSRGLSTLRYLKKLHSNNIHHSNAIRNSHQWNYRSSGPPPDKKLVSMAEITQGVAWWWVLWHLWTEPGHIIGEYEYPDARKWTDEELGISDD